MTFMANIWDKFITGLLRPFVRIQHERMKLKHTIEMDKQSSQDRHLEAILESQENLAKEMHATVAESTAVLRDWLEGFHKIQQTPLKAPPTNDDERQWRMEMEANAEKLGMNASNFSSSELEALIRQEFSSL